VLVKPNPLRNPRLIVHSRDMAAKLLLSESDVNSEEFARFFSGDVNAVEEGFVPTWATPYALSIMGNRYTSNCPYGTGDGYGDGRAMSIGEMLIPTKTNPNNENDDSTTTSAASERYELQLKGAGPTPFCRGADGRAVLRSSIREFLASEAMHHLGISTTRALSLVVSENSPSGSPRNTSRRPWYSESNKEQKIPSMNDPRLMLYPKEKRIQIIEAMKTQKRDPDTMIEEPNAITTRVASSFVRIGHLDLFARRATSFLGGGGKVLDQYEKGTSSWEELEEMIWHAAYREFRTEAYDPYRATNDIASAGRALLTGSLDKLSLMTAQWIRVGFCQGNFNADNCLVAGRTMDYGPFGFMDKYDPLFAKWTGSGEHYGFLNQPMAGLANYKILVESVMPVVTDDVAEWQRYVDAAQTMFRSRVGEALREKMGFELEDATHSEGLFESLEPLLKLNGGVDWTLFWRQLYRITVKYPLPSSSKTEDYESMFQLLSDEETNRDGSSPFYEPLTSDVRQQYIDWITSWRVALIKSTTEKQNGAGNVNELITERMRLSNPKYILREWMLVDAYTQAAEGDEAMIHDLLALVEAPYDEGTEEQHHRFYRRAPDEALNAGGTAFMS